MRILRLFIKDDPDSPLFMTVVEEDSPAHRTINKLADEKGVGVVSDRSSSWLEVVKWLEQL